MDNGDIQVSVIFATYNREDVIRDVLEQWVKVDSHTKYKYEIICSDDESSDKTVSIIEEYQNLPILVLKNKHGGASSARNNALKAARGKVVVFTGDDIFPEADFVNRHYENYLKYGDKFCTLGRVEWHPDIKVNHLMKHITEIGCEQFGFVALPPYSIVDFRHFYTCNISVAKSELDKLDEHFSNAFDRYGFEDIELGYRLHKNGVKIIYDPNVLGYHHHVYHDVDKFCNRQNSAGNQMVVFATLHEDIRDYELMGVRQFEQIMQECSDMISSSESERGKYILQYIEKLKDRTRTLEDKILRQDKPEWRAECSGIYKLIFQMSFYIGWASRFFADQAPSESALAELVCDYLGGPYAQIFESDGTGFSEEKSLKIMLHGRKNQIEKKMTGVSTVRLDPFNGACIVEGLKAFVETDEKKLKAVKWKRSNAQSVNENNFVFDNEPDPQIVFSGFNKSRLYNVHFEYTVYPKECDTYGIDKIKRDYVCIESNQKRDYGTTVYEKQKLRISVEDAQRIVSEEEAGEYKRVLNAVYGDRVVLEEGEAMFSSQYVLHVDQYALKPEELIFCIRWILDGNYEGVAYNGCTLYNACLSQREKSAEIKQLKVS